MIVCISAIPDAVSFPGRPVHRQVVTPAWIYALLERAWNSQRGSSEGGVSMAQKLFIGGLAFSTSTERLREVFAAAGQVESAAVVTDRDTGRSRGFGFVEMATAEEADQAIAQFNGKDLDGRQLRVEKASAGGARGGGGGNSRGFGGSSRGGRW